MMYNQEIKERFYRDYSEKSVISRYLFDSIFNASANLEEAYDKDICNFSKAEIDTYYKSLNAKSKERLSVANSILNSYRIWCEAEQPFEIFESINYYALFNLQSFAGFISKSVLENKFISEETLKSYLKDIINPCDQLLLVLLYNGIKGRQMEDIRNLNVSQIEGNVIHLEDGRDVEVSQDIIDLIIETNNTYEYYSMGENQRKYVLIGDNVMKSKKLSKMETGRNFYHSCAVKVAKFQDQFGNPELSMNRIWKSGMLYKAKKLANEKGIDIKEFLYSDDAKPLYEQYSVKQSPHVFYANIKEYLPYLKEEK